MLGFFKSSILDFRKFHVEQVKGFICYTQKNLSLPIEESLILNWKARLSIAPEDFSKAYDLFMPILLKNHPKFKLINVPKNQKRAEKQRAALSEIQANFSEFNLLCKGGLGLDTLQDFLWHFYFLTPEQPNLFQKVKECILLILSTLWICFLTGERLTDYTALLYQPLIADFTRRLEAFERFYHGMQVTLYIPPGSEHACQAMLEEIEQVLLEHSIKPGKIYPTDRQIGQYSSVRHPGLHEYHHALKVDNYNPDGADDPFEALSTYKPSEAHLVTAQYSNVTYNA